MPTVCRILALALSALLLINVAVASEPTEAEALLDKLNELETTKSRSLAKRWEGLIRLRQWKSNSGKHTTYAKYVDHAPDMSSVKLLVVVRKGDERSEKVLDISLDKLDKDAATLVKRIAKAREAVEELVADAANSPEESGSARKQERGAPPRGSAKRSEQASAAEGRRRSKNPALRSVGLGNQQIPDLNTPEFPDDAAWRTSYDAFVKNLSAKKIDPEGPSHEISNWELDWGKLQDLRWQWKSLSLELKSRAGKLDREELMTLQKKSAEASPNLGEVMWTGTLKRDLATNPEAVISFDHPAPPEPFEILYVVDADFADTAKPLKKGNQVRFIGRFKSFGIGMPMIVIHARFPQSEVDARAGRAQGEYFDPEIENYAPRK